MAVTDGVLQSPEFLFLMFWGDAAHPEARLAGVLDPAGDHDAAKAAVRAFLDEIRGPLQENIELAAAATPRLMASAAPPRLMASAAPPTQVGDTPVDDDGPTLLPSSDWTLAARAIDAVRHGTVADGPGASVVWGAWQFTLEEPSASRQESTASTMTYVSVVPSDRVTVRHVAQEGTANITSQAADVVAAWGLPAPAATDWGWHEGQGYWC